MLQATRYPKIPELKTELPGPLSKTLIEKDEKYTSPSYTRAYPLAVARGEGMLIEDYDGNVFLDFTSGIAVCATGHCHPRIVSAIQNQAQHLIHMSGTDFYYGPQQELAEKLANIAPGNSPKKVFFTNSGAESVEAAFKLARFHTKREKVIAFFGSFHGRTMGALSLTGSKAVQRRGFGPLIPGVIHVEYPNCYRCPLKTPGNPCCLKMLDHIEQNLFPRIAPPDEIAAVIVEPIQGEGGYIVPPPEFHQRLKAITEKHDILYIADEVQSGMGRTGKMFAIEHWGVEPDIVCLAKGLASGMPLGAIVAKEHIMDWPPGAHASTFGGNPVCCAASLETIALLEEGLVAHSAEMGFFLKSKLDQLATRHDLVGEVRGLGLMLAVELVTDKFAKTPAKKERDRIVESCFRKGLLLLGCGENAVRFAPPLIVEETDILTAIKIFDEALTELTAS